MIISPCQGRIDLSKLDTNAKLGLDKDTVEKQMLDAQQRVASLQHKLWAENKRALLCVFQGMDASGKDGTVRDAFFLTNPDGVKVTSFKVPSAEELDHDFLWRIHKAVPARGEIGAGDQDLGGEDAGIALPRRAGTGGQDRAEDRDARERRGACRVAALAPHGFRPSSDRRQLSDTAASTGRPLSVQPTIEGSYITASSLPRSSEDTNQPIEAQWPVLQKLTSGPSVGTPAAA